MNEENQTSKESAEPSEVSPPAQLSEPLSTLPAPEPATEKQLDKVEREMNAFERSTLKWTRATFFILFVTCLFIGFQWYEMRSGSADTHSLAEQAKRQAEKMSNMSDAAEKIRQAAENMVIQDQRIADNARNAIEASNRQSRDALNASIANAQLDQRAWVGVPEFVTTGGSQSSDGKIFSFNELLIVIRNSGKTPALNLSAATLALSKDSLEKIGDYDAEIAKISAKFSGQSQMNTGPSGALFPAEQVLSPGAAINQIASQGGQWTIRDDVNNRFFIPYVLGKITYNDIFSRKKHTAEFCFERNVGSNFVPCFHGNWMD